MTKIQLKRSSALLSGSAQAPTSSQLDYGELAINYNSSDPQLFFKDSTGSVVSLFDNYAALSGATFTGDVAFSADVDFDGAVTIKGDSTNGSGKLSLTCEQNTHTVNIKAPAHSSAANYTLTLPSSAGTSSQVLTTDGSGNLSWAVSSMSVADKNKLNGIETGAQVNTVTSVNGQTGAVTVSGSTDLSYTASTRVLASSTGNDATIPEVIAAGDSGLMTGADKTKLDGIEANATADQTAAEILSALLTVDGSGSGLDADLLDGLNANSAYSTSTVVTRDGNGDIRGRYLIAGTADGVGGWIRSRTGADSNITPTSFVVESSGWYYQLSKSDFQNAISSGLNADNLDGYTWNSSGKDLRGNEIYADNWFRNYNSGEGLYNQQNAMHWYSQSNNSFSLYSTQGSVAMRMMTAGGTIRGYLYADTASSIGFLNAAGQWGLRYLSTDGRSPNLYFLEEANETWSGNPGNDQGKIEYHSNRFYIASGSNSTEIVRFRRSSSDVAYINNSGYFYSPIMYDFNNTAYYCDPASYCSFYRGEYRGYNGSTTSGNAVSLEIENASGTGDNGVAAMSFHCAGYYAMHMHLRHDSYFGIGGWSASAWRWYVQMSTGNMTAAGNVTAYSDIRLKEEIEPLHGCLAKLIGLNGVSFRWKDLPDVVGHPGEKDFGIIAQEVEKVFPEVIHESAHESPDGDKYKTVAYDKLVPVLIEAVKELSVRLTSLEDKL